MKTRLFRKSDRASPDWSKGFATGKLVSEPTTWLRKLHSHTTRLKPGAGYAPHVDAYDVAILIESGRVETLGQEVGPGSVIYYAAGTEHGLRNVGDEPADYLVFEFHAPALALADGASRSAMKMARRVLGPVKRRLQAALH